MVMPTLTDLRHNCFRLCLWVDVRTQKGQLLPFLATCESTLPQRRFAFEAPFCDVRIGGAVDTQGNDSDETSILWSGRYQ